MSDPIDKLRKLVAMSEAEGTTPAEAERFAEQARALAAKYHLDLRAAVDYEVEDALIERPSDIVIGTTRMRRYMWILAWIVADAHGCVPWILERYSIKIGELDEIDLDAALAEAWRPGVRRDAVVRVVGPGYDRWIVFEAAYAPNLDEEDVRDAADVGGASLWRSSEYKRERLLMMVGRSQIADAAIYVYRVLLGQIEEIAKRVSKGQGRTARNSARLGVIAGLRSRLDSTQHEALSPASDGEPVQTTAMILAGAREESERYLADAFGSKPFSGGGRSDISIDGCAFRAGLAAADEIEIPDPDGRRAALGHGRALGPAE